MVWVATRARPWFMHCPAKQCTGTGRWASAARHITRDNANHGCAEQRASGSLSIWKLTHLEADASGSISSNTCPMPQLTQKTGSTSGASAERRLPRVQGDGDRCLPLLRLRLLLRPRQRCPADGERQRRPLLRLRLRLVPLLLLRLLPLLRRPSLLWLSLLLVPREVVWLPLSHLLSRCPCPTAGAGCTDSAGAAAALSRAGVVACSPPAPTAERGGDSSF